FFSSRRRHTSSRRDWSSDVCSSDLGGGGSWGRGRLRRRWGLIRWSMMGGRRVFIVGGVGRGVRRGRRRRRVRLIWRRRKRGGRKIGRASCRERVWRAGVGGSATEEG